MKSKIIVLHNMYSHQFIFNMSIIIQKISNSCDRFKDARKSKKLKKKGHTCIQYDNNGCMIWCNEDFICADTQATKMRCDREAVALYSNYYAKDTVVYLLQNHLFQELFYGVISIRAKIHYKK